MMMSIFSSFDALSAELIGQKVNQPTSDKKQKGVAPIVSDRKTAAASPPSTSSIGGLNKAGEAAAQPQQHRRPSFAPELDGVHCFETIIPY
ncbi:unnamed protein product [Withania somnifera]